MSNKPIVQIRSAVLEVILPDYAKKDQGERLAESLRQTLADGHEMSVDVTLQICHSGKVILLSCLQGSLGVQTWISVLQRHADIFWQKEPAPQDKDLRITARRLASRSRRGTPCANPASRCAP